MSHSGSDAHPICSPQYSIGACALPSMCELEDREFRLQTYGPQHQGRLPLEQHHWQAK